MILKIAYLSLEDGDSMFSPECRHQPTNPHDAKTQDFNNRIWYYILINFHLICWKYVLNVAPSIFWTPSVALMIKWVWHACAMPQRSKKNRFWHVPLLCLNDVHFPINDKRLPCSAFINWCAFSLNIFLQPYAKYDTEWFQSFLTCWGKLQILLIYLFGICATSEDKHTFVEP